MEEELQTDYAKDLWNLFNKYKEKGFDELSMIATLECHKVELISRLKEEGNGVLKG